MCAQINVLKRFDALYPNLTIRKISIMTRIDPTRIFRIKKGSRMKIDEYEVFRRLVNQKETNFNTDLYTLLEECILLLSSNVLEDLKINMQRIVEHKKLIS